MTPSFRELKRVLWPKVTFYDRQWEIIESFEHCPETYVPAGNMLGKDFVSGFLCVVAFLKHPVVRVVNTSVKDDHLMVLWGEINRFIDTAEKPLVHGKGGPLIVNHRHVKKVLDGSECPISYLKGMVAGAGGEALAGHHAPATYGVGDEASGLTDKVYDQMQGWCKRMLFIGNPNPCENFFRRAVDGGDILRR